MSKLSRLNDDNIPNSKSVAVEVIREGEVVLDRAIEDRRSNFLQRLIPDARLRALMEAEVGIIRSELEFRRVMLAKVREAQSQSLTERLNECLIREKATIRSETTVFMLSELNDLIVRMNKLYDDFERDMEEKFAKLESISIPKLRAMREQDIDRTIEIFSEMKEELMVQFQRIVSERV
jgi:uncharacterized protein YacL (UPF0231 family)